MARYRDRRVGRTFTFVGSDIYSDGTARGQAKNVYEPGSNIVNNWDCLEGVLDYVFIKLGVDGRNGSIDRPVVMTEPVANLGYARKRTYLECRKSLVPSSKLKSGLCPGVKRPNSTLWCICVPFSSFSVRFLGLRMTL